MNYETLLREAPAHDSAEFMEYLKEKNKVVYESISWLVIENFKYHTKEKPHYTAFWQTEHNKHPFPDIYAIMGLQDEFRDFDFLIKARSRRSVQRFHIHLIKEL